MEGQRIVSKEQGETFAGENEMKFCETSARENLNVELAFMTVNIQMKKNWLETKLFSWSKIYLASKNLLTERKILVESKLVKDKATIRQHRKPVVASKYDASLEWNYINNIISLIFYTVTSFWNMFHVTCDCKYKRKSGSLNSSLMHLRFE